MIENFEKLLYAYKITKLTLKRGNFDKTVNEEYNIEPILVTQEPTRFPYEKYQEMASLATTMNKLIYNLSQDDHNIQNDDMSCLLSKIKKIKRKKDLDIVFLRTDYLLDRSKPIQVEINTISCAFLFSGPKVNKLHKLYNSNTLVSNSDIEFICMVKEVLKHYGKNEEKGNNIGDNNEQSPVFLMIDDKNDMSCSNFYEKIEIIKKMKENNIDVLHITYEQLQKDIRFLMIDGTEITKDRMDKMFTEHLDKAKQIECKYNLYYKNRLVFFIYYRWFYNFSQHSEKDILLRAQLECSTATSLPSVELQIAGSKLLQIKLKERMFLQKYLNQSEIDHVYNYFGEFKSFDEYQIGDEFEYILKSVNEGGGNNIFGKDILKYKGDITSKFLMKIIKSPVFDNKFYGDTQNRKIIPEIGIMGWALIKDGKMIINRQSGYICRSKDEKSNECGVSCGFGALDSILKD